jgi:hypothetical protein
MLMIGNTTLDTRGGTMAMVSTQGSVCAERMRPKTKFAAAQSRLLNNDRSGRFHLTSTLLSPLV